MSEPQVYCANFMIGGRILRPTAMDYAIEARRLREQAVMVENLSGSTRLYEVAERFASLARRKGWAEQQAEQRVRHIAEGT